MNDLRSQLQRSDPVAHEAGPSLSDTERMRRHILSARPEVAPRRGRALLTLAAIVLLAGLGSALLLRAPLPPPPAEPPAVVLGGAIGVGSPPRQLQYRTSGGTRVFWTFNPNLEVR
jgi:hypothetical protein